MKKPYLAVMALAAFAIPAIAQDAPAPSPNEIVDQASTDDWVAIAPEDLLVMTLAPAADGTERKVVIQLMPAPFSQGWVENIRLLARSGWYDDISVNRVQDNYVVQWGDPNYDNPEATGEAKPLPEGLRMMGKGDYTARVPVGLISPDIEADFSPTTREGWPTPILRDAYASSATFESGWPFAFRQYPDKSDRWPVHCYGMVGVGRGYSPDTGSGAELYTVIGHAPRHLDRNIALVGRVIEGIEHLSSLPRGTGNLGFYESAEERVPIQTIRVASDLPPAEQPSFEYLSTESETFARYAEARANRRDPFFIAPAGGADICNIPVPVRRDAD
ncbi:peptidylprolyl isomerase [Altererythrobacter aurantiacus]|uniref:Peptidylprolyl isomerase n=1 Tax=Parapontixanthobacter aurantiacus TaxID=1463599 RepID=A0A844ZEL3_9SPHN|nr:peptidylprolyl isomerase [Parapontixanthobacter aurantiacus]MXO85984.1 peptidylprolyl isomerase [Parapontixanthobacter aurantiacus]